MPFMKIFDLRNCASDAEESKKLTMGGNEIMRNKFYRKVTFAGFLLIMMFGFCWPWSSQAQSKVNLELWIGEPRPAYKKILSESIDTFTKQHPNMTIKAAQMLPRDIQLKWPAAAATGTLPDITWVYSGYVANLEDMEKAGLLPVDDIIKELGGEKKFTSLPDWKYKGHYRGIPVWRLPVWLSYRADLFAKAGLKPPQKWTDVLEAAKKLNDPANNFFGIALAGGREYEASRIMQTILYGYGGQTMNKDCKPVFNTPECVAALKMLQNLFQYAPPGAVSWIYMDNIRAFAMGRTAMCLSYTTTLETIATTSPHLVPHIRIALPHETVPNVTHEASRGWGIFASTKYPQEAKMFVKHLFNPKTVGDFCTVLPLALAPAYLHSEVYQRVRESETAKKFAPEIVDKILSPTLKGYDRGIGECGPNKWAGIMSGERIFETAVNNMLTQGWTAEKTAALVQEQMEKIISENK
jgi:multiple sugar transport system substrate-binding protein